jgi:hypothetical protein
MDIGTAAQALMALADPAAANAARKGTNDKDQVARKQTAEALDAPHASDPAAPERPRKQGGRGRHLDIEA